VPQQLEVHRVFLASPSDVLEERAVALEVANRLNTTILQAQGKLLHLTGWEYLTPTAGRPQDIINALVDDCDVFVGLLYQRWGTPTGRWSSGFEEEFYRAQARFERTGVPHISILFKVPTPRVDRSPSSDYERILSFRQSISQSHLYETVISVEDWRYKLSLLLQKAVSVGPGKPSPPDGEIATKQALRHAIVRLSERQQTVLGLHYFEGMTVQQVSEVLGVSRQSISRIHREAISRLRKDLPDDVVNTLETWTEG
jgi:RNA polymerase sigma factor (sigma-70 family)